MISYALSSSLEEGNRLTDDQQLGLPVFDGIVPASVRLSLTGSITNQKHMPGKILKLNEMLPLEAQGRVVSVVHNTGRDEDIVRGAKIKIETLRLPGSSNGAESAADRSLSLPMFDGKRPSAMKLSVGGTITDDANMPRETLRLYQPVTLQLDGVISSVVHSVTKDDEVIRASKFNVDRVTLIETPPAAGVVAGQSPLGIDE